MGKLKRRIVKTIAAVLVIISGGIVIYTSLALARQKKYGCVSRNQ